MRVLTVIFLLATAGAALADGDATPPTRVEFGLTVRGDLFAPAGDGHEPMREPIEVDAAFDFVELAGDIPGSATSRRYRRATAAVKVGDRTDRTTLAVDAREVMMELVGTTPTPSLAAGFLSRQEAELLDTPFDPLLLRQLAPDVPKATGDTWKVPADVVAGMLSIDTVTEGAIEVVLTDAGEAGATLELTGTVTGAVDGVATRITVEGTARAACSPSESAATWTVAKAIDQLDATLAERREAGWVAPGLDVSATITMRRGAMLPDDTHRLDAPAIGRPTGQGLAGTVWHRHPHGRYTLVLDRRWRVVEDGPEGLVMRLVDHGALVAQCSILPLPRSAPDAPPTVDEVSRDVEMSLGDQFGHIASAEATTRDDGTRMVRVMAEGSAEGRAFRWIHHVLSDKAGYRSAVTFMLEPAMADRFGGGDHELVAGVVLLPDPARKTTPTTAAQPPANRNAQRPD